MMEVVKIRAKEEYGDVHDCQKAPERLAILDKGGITGRPDLYSGVRDRKVLFEALLERYTGGELQARARERVELYQFDNVDLVSARGSIRYDNTV